MRQRVLGYKCVNILQVHVFAHMPHAFTAETKSSFNTLSNVWRILGSAFSAECKRVKSWEFLINAHFNRLTPEYVLFN